MRWLSKSSRSPGSISTGVLAAHVVVDDLGVAVVGAGPGVGDVLVHRLGVRSGEHVQAAVLEGGLGDRQPHPDDRAGRLEGEVVAVLVPGLAPGAPVLEDELRQETRDVVGARAAPARGRAPRVGRRTRRTPDRGRRGRSSRPAPRAGGRPGRPGPPSARTPCRGRPPGRRPAPSRSPGGAWRCRSRRRRTRASGRSRPARSSSGRQGRGRRGGAPEHSASRLDSRAPGPQP